MICTISGNPYNPLKSKQSKLTNPRLILSMNLLIPRCFSSTAPFGLSIPTRPPKTPVKTIFFGTHYHHRWELPGNYRDFIVVMVFYLFCWITKRIFVTNITVSKFYILIQSFMLFIWENNWVIIF